VVWETFFDTPPGTGIEINFACSFKSYKQNSVLFNI
jgi:hypothetical protein